MANTKNSKNIKPEKKTVAPIKVEKINTSDNSKKEVLAIIIGILVIAALITGSVIYFRSDGEDLTKPNKKRDDIVNVKPDNKPSKKIKKDTSDGNNTYRLIPLKASTKSSIDDEDEEDEDDNYVYVKKACTSNCTRIDVNTKTTKAKGNGAKGKTDKEYFKSNNITTTYVATSENTFNVNVSGSLTTTANDLKILAKTSVQLATDKAVKTEINARKTVAAKTSGNVKLSDKVYATDGANDATVKNKLETAVDNEVAKELENLSTVDDTDGLIAVAANENDTVATYAFNVRIDDSNKIDWEHGVTVKVTYNKGGVGETSVTKKYKKDANANYSYQDENGINIAVIADADDFNTKAQIDNGTAVEKKIDLDLDYYNLEGANIYNGGAGEEKHTSYTVDMTNVYIKDDDDPLTEGLSAAEIATNNDYKSAKKLTDPDTTPGVIDTVDEQVTKNADELENKVMTLVTSDEMVAEIKGVADTDMSGIDEEITGVIEDVDYTGALTNDIDAQYDTTLAAQG